MPKAISQDRLFEEIGYVPHAGEVEIHRSRARNKVVAAGRRFGKSHTGGHKLVPEVYKAFYKKQELLDTDKRMEFWIVGPEYSDSEKEFRVLWDVCKRLEMPFDRPGTYNDPIGGNMHMSLWEGRFQVHGMSAKYPDSLVGEGLHGVILSEAAKLKERIWSKYIRPTLADFTGWSFMSSTPEGKNWFYDMWRNGQNPEMLEWESWRRPSWMNPHVYQSPTVYADVIRAQRLLKDPNQFAPGELRARLAQLVIDPEIQSLVTDLTETSFNQEIAALFTEFTGRVFKDFDEEIHVTDLQFDATWETYGAVDYGFTNPNVWLLVQVGPWGQVNVLEEVYQPGLTADEFADEILLRNLCPSSLKTFYPDPASPGDTKIMERILKARGAGGTGGEVKHRVDAIRKALKVGPPHDTDPNLKRPTLMIDRRCTSLIADMGNYRYPEKRAGTDTNSVEQPLKKDDHGPEALGRFFAGRFLTPQAQARRARQRSSTLAGRRSG